MVGLILQIVVVVGGLFVSWLLARKGHEKWGYFAGFWMIFVWAVEEAYFQQWFLFSLNPIYFWLYAKGWYNHRGAK